MTKEKNMSGVTTTFNDKDGNPIKIHDYVKDAEGNRYYINSHCQAVPEGGDAPAVELERLIDTTDVSVMSIEEVLDMKPQVERRRHGGRRKKEDPGQQAAEQAKAEAEARRAEEEAKAEAEARKAEEEAKAKAAAKEAFARKLAEKAAEKAQKAAEGEMHPVTEQMLLGVIPDDVLANELRRRGYTLCAVRPALIEL